MSSSIHIQKASEGAITHNSRENYSKSVVFFDENNELWNSKKEAYEIYKSELSSRVQAYTNRTNQKLQKTAVTQLSAVVNLEQHHTLKDLEKIKEELEKVFDTKVYQIAIHRDEGKLKHKVTGEYLASGIDFHLNPKDNKYYFEKRVENKEHIYEKELDINDYEIEKNYHAHIEMMGLDSKGGAIRQKMNRFVLSKLQDFTALTLNMERGKSYLVEKSSKRLDTHEFKPSKKQENEVEKKTKKIVKEANKIIDEANEAIDRNRTNAIKANEIIKDEKAKVKEEKEKSKALNELLTLKEKEIKRLMQEIGGFKRVDYAEVEALKKELTTAKASEVQIEESYRSLQSKYELKKKEVNELTNKLHLMECNEIVLIEELKEIKLEVYSSNWELENKPMKNVAVVEYLQDENMKINESLKKVQDLKLELQELNKKLESDLNSLQEQNRVLEDKVTDLQEKLTHSPNMSDYEQIKKENVELKKENSILSRMFNNAVVLINVQIERLLEAGIFGRTKKYTEEEARDMAERQIKNSTPVTPVAKKEDYEHHNDWGMQR